MTLAEFETRCRPAADTLEDATSRYVSSWRDWDAAYPTLWPFVVWALLRRFPWELAERTL